MIRRLYLWESGSFDPYENLAVEEALLGQVDGSAILYLWRNENTVVIGKNQNLWKECKTALLFQEGGKLARRLSGGGAVYHDLGNLNFTLLLPQEDFDLHRQLSVICQAVGSLGIPAEISGRNDLLAEGRKFSGSAFYKNGRQAYHHGTLLVRADLEKMGRYLSPSMGKLRAKGVDSVRSRVENLSHWQKDITVEALKQALKAAFSRVYGLPLEPLPAPDGELVSKLARRNAGQDWLYGPKLPFSCTLEGRFLWGGVELALAVEHGKIRQAKLYTDAMDTDWARPLEEALIGCSFQGDAVRSRLAELPMGADVSTLLKDV